MGKEGRLWRKDYKSQNVKGFEDDFKKFGYYFIMGENGIIGFVFGKENFVFIVEYSLMQKYQR